MLAISKSQRFQQEREKFRSQIDHLTTPAMRQKAENLLSKLDNEVKYLDGQHDEMFITNKLPVRLDEVKSKIQEIRRELDRLLRDTQYLRSKQSS